MVNKKSTGGNWELEVQTGFSSAECDCLLLAGPLPGNEENLSSSKGGSKGVTKVVRLAGHLSSCWVCN